MNDYLWAAAGFALLIVGAEALVHGGVAVARRLNLSPLLIGVTIVAYGTSTPELVVSVDAAFKGAYGIAVGNVIGSNILNVLLILGLTAVISPIAVSARALGHAIFALIATGLFVWLASRRSVLTAEEGILFLAILLAMMLISYGRERGREAVVGGRPRFMKPRPLSYSPVLDATLILAGLGLLIMGAEVLVESSIGIARSQGISEAIIGLTLVAAGTSLPELATSIVAALRGHAGIALGNIVGSNIYNILAVLGVASFLGPLEIDPQMARIDIWVMAAATVALFPPLLFARQIGRMYGLLLLAAYAAYVVFLAQKAGLLHLPINP